ncbi:hypothetical protein [Kitasatospora griseola]|uniref:hypothetical protein n=1 Tax=Kitasatospora griseola TaxID=2064 RepID=UPI00344214D6
MTYRTVQRLADATAPEDLSLGQWQNRRTEFDGIIPYLHEHLDSLTHGYHGGYRAIRAYLQTVPHNSHRTGSPTTIAADRRRADPAHLDALPESERPKLKSVLAGCPELDALTGHVRTFGRMLTQLQGDELPAMDQGGPRRRPAQPPHLSSTASNAISQPSPPARHCRGTPASSKATSTGSK